MSKVEFKPGSKGNVYKFNLTENPNGVRVKEGFNVRKDYGDLEELKNSIIEKGLQVPAFGRRATDETTKEKYWQISDGHRRLKAAIMAVNEGHEVIFLIQSEPQHGYTELDRLVAMSIRNTGKPLTPIEEAELFSRMRNEGLTAKEISKAVSKSYVHVNSMLNLLDNATEGTKDLINDGSVSATVVAGMQKAKLAPEEIEENIKEALDETGKERVTAKDIPGALTGRERKQNLPATSMEDTEESGEAMVEPKPRKEPTFTDPADEEPTGKPANRLKSIKIDIREINDAVLEEISKGGTYTDNAKHILELLERFGKKQITLPALVSSFVYIDEAVEAV